eukprot:TRINITY_DN65969_c0_g1_i1.p1 TRINITY_DN65969_c0_g1~~TRINITY_DN65969_c0_g1_i1.p1  ORF type:complete len:429 (+),score=144.47 TRINITY_DN65969_c0_g1_i1:78-1289(+)
MGEMCGAGAGVRPSVPHLALPAAGYMPVAATGNQHPPALPVLSSHKLFFPGMAEKGMSSALHLYNCTDRTWLFRVRLNRELQGGWSQRHGRELPRVLAARPPFAAGAELAPGQEVTVWIDVVSDAARELRAQQEASPPGSGRSAFRLRVDFTDPLELDPTGQPLRPAWVEIVSVRFADPAEEHLYDVVQPVGGRRTNVSPGWWETRAARYQRSARAASLPGRQPAHAPAPSAPLPPELAAVGDDAGGLLQELDAVSAELERRQHQSREIATVHAQLHKQLAQLGDQRDAALARLQALTAEQVAHEARLSGERKAEETAAQRQLRKIQELTRQVEEADKQIQLLRGDIENEETEKLHLRLKNQLAAQEKEQREGALALQLAEVRTALRLLERRKTDSDGGCTVQ